MDLQFLTALVIIACGVFILVYGSLLFRFVLAVGGFYIGFTLAGMLPVLMDPTVKFIMQLVVGGILAALAYGLVRFSLNVAGALLGFVAGLFINSLLGLSGGWLAPIIAVGVGIVGGIFGTRLGDWVTILACAIAGSYAIVGGMNLMFTGGSATTLPRTLPAFTAFLIFAITGTLAQHQIVDLRRRLLRR